MEPINRLLDEHGAYINRSFKKGIIMMKDLRIGEIKTILEANKEDASVYMETLFVILKSKLIFNNIGQEYMSQLLAVSTDPILSYKIQELIEIGNLCDDIYEAISPHLTFITTICFDKIIEELIFCVDECIVELECLAFNHLDLEIQLKTMLGKINKIRDTSLKKMSKMFFRTPSKDYTLDPVVALKLGVANLFEVLVHIAREREIILSGTTNDNKLYNALLAPTKIVDPRLKEYREQFACFEKAYTNFYDLMDYEKDKEKENYERKALYH